MPIIITIQPHLVGIDDRVVIPHRYVLWVAGVVTPSFLLLLLGIIATCFVGAPMFY
jgi:hypothetical protein